MSKDERIVVGQADGDIPVLTASEVSKISAEMVGLSKHQLDIVSRSLEPLIYNTPAFIAATKNLVLNRRGRVRIIVLEPANLVSNGNHRLVDLVMRVSSLMEIRRPGEYHLAFNEAMLIADRRQVVHRKHSDRYAGVANFNAPRLASNLSETFEAIWQNAETPPDFRRLML